MTDNIKLDKPIELLELDPPSHYFKSCFFGHKWSSWEDTDSSGAITVDDRRVGRYMYQERRCSRCNKLELNKITTYAS